MLAMSLGYLGRIPNPLQVSICMRVGSLKFKDKCDCLSENLPSSHFPVIREIPF